MKRILTITMMTAFTVFVFASSLEAQGQNPKATNYKEVLKGIEYPKVCREKGIEGTVLVSLKINEKGDILNYKFKSAPCEELQTAVEKSLDKLKFEPAKNQHGQAVIGRLVLPVNFRLTI